MRAIVLLVVLMPFAQCHMSLVNPKPRNAIDSRLPLWAGGKWWPYQPFCQNPRYTPHWMQPRDKNWNPQIPSGCVPAGTDGWGCNCANGTSPCDVGQSCLWFSDGCSIGCNKCDGLGGNPNTRDRCNSGKNATICDPKLRTYNQDAECNTKADIYRWNPWRAPGSAPVLDSCGMAGGGYSNMGGEAKYTPTKFAKVGMPGRFGSNSNNSEAMNKLAKMGMPGKLLPPAPTGVKWRRGEVVTASWTIRANHGGGYQYRLCPAHKEATEECFFQNPMQFASRTHTLTYSNSSNPVRAESWKVNATFVNVGTLPEGSTWARNPLPYSNSHQVPTFDPPCIESIDRKQSDTGKCSGRDPYNTLITDELRVPIHLAPGPYIFGIRWDCEKSGSCSSNSLL